MSKNKNRYLILLSEGVLFFVISLIVNYFASMYASVRVSVPVTDIVLSNFPVMDVDGFIVYGSLLLFVLLIIYLVRHPYKMPFTLKSIALFVFIRSIFITLTHLGPFTPQVQVAANAITSFGLGNAADLFFSGHTGMPFLGALVFWDNKELRYLFLTSSIMLGTAVLLGHLHYSIDVLAAFFITYTIFQISKFLFRYDWKLFHAK